MTICIKLAALTTLEPVAAQAATGQCIDATLLEAAALPPTAQATLWLRAAPDDISWLGSD